MNRTHIPSSLKSLISLMTMFMSLMTFRRQSKSRYTELSSLPHSFYGCETNYLSTVYEKAKPRPHGLLEEDSWHYMAKTHPRLHKVLIRGSLLSIYNILMQLQLRWVGHLVQMKDHRLSKKLLNGELSQDKRSHGR